MPITGRSPVLSAAVAAVEVLLALAAVVEEPPHNFSGSWMMHSKKKKHNSGTFTIFFKSCFTHILNIQWCQDWLKQGQPKAPHLFLLLQALSD